MQTSCTSSMQAGTHPVLIEEDVEGHIQQLQVFETHVLEGIWKLLGSCWCLVIGPQGGCRHANAPRHCMGDGLEVAKRLKGASVCKRELNMQAGDAMPCCHESATRRSDMSIPKGQPHMHSCGGRQLRV